MLRALDRLADGGNTVLVVDHDLELMRAAEHLVEIGPGDGRDAGRLDAVGAVYEPAADPRSVTCPYLAGTAPQTVRDLRPVDDATPQLNLYVDALHNLRDLTAAFPMGRLTVVSGSGRSSLVLGSLVPALQTQLSGQPLPPQVECS